MSKKSTELDTESLMKDRASIKSLASAEQPAIPCCPDLGSTPVCSILTFDYRLLHFATVREENNRTIPIEVKIHTRFERCPGPLTLGDLVYSNTLFPGEKVRLFTADRRTRFTFDSTTKVSYRNEQTSEEQWYDSSWADFMSDVNVRDAARSSNTNKGSFQGHGETSGVLSSIFGSPSVDVSGSYDSQSTSEFLRELSEHASSSHHRAEIGARASSTISIGEVQSRTHTAAESEDHFESSTREFANPNKCHAVTFFFYRINKTQTVKFTIESIERRIIDPAGNTKVTNNAFTSRGDLFTIPNGVLATDKERLQTEEVGRASIAAEQQGVISSSIGSLGGGVGVLALATTTPPIPQSSRQKALKQVDQQLVAVGLLEKEGGNISPQVQKQFSFEVQSSLPTPGVLVKGCLDDCNVCEPDLIQEIELGLERKKLENELLKRQTELLEKSQEYRCCPPGSEPPEE